MSAGGNPRTNLSGNPCLHSAGEANQANAQTKWAKLVPAFDFFMASQAWQHLQNGDGALGRRVRLARCSLRGWPGGYCSGSELPQGGWLKAQAVAADDGVTVIRLRSQGALCPAGAGQAAELVLHGGVRRGAFRNDVHFFLIARTLLELEHALTA